MGNADDRWIWRASIFTRKPHPPPSILSSEAHGITLFTEPINTIKSTRGSETLPSTSPASRPTHPGAIPGWLWSSELVTTQSSGKGKSKGSTSPTSLWVTESSTTNTTLLQGLASPATWIVTPFIHTAPSLTAVPQQYTRYLEVYDIQYRTNSPVIAWEIQAEFSHPSSFLVLSILVASLLLSLVNNLVMLFAILRRSYLRQTIFVLYMNLAASDLLASFLSIPVAIIVISHGGSEEQRHDGGPPVGACMLLNAGVVLMSYVSVGSIVGICTVRWCQFYNFSKTRARERLAIRLFMLFLWTTGVGITAGLIIRQAVSTAEIRCTPLHLATILNDTLPFSSIFIIIGLILVALVNHLTIRKLSRSTVCPYPGHETPIIRRFLTHCTNTVPNLHNNATSEQSSLNGYPNTFSNNVLQGQCFSVNENDTTNTEVRNSSTAQIKSETASPNNTGGKNERYLSNDLSTTFPHQFCNISSSRSLPLLAIQPLLPLPWEISGLNKEENKNPRSACQIKLGSADNSIETDFESEDLYEAIEPFDVQEVTTSTEGNPREQVQPFRQRVLLPNVVETIYNTSPSVRKLQTILVNTSSALDMDYTVNAAAWRIGNAMASEASYQATSDSIGIQRTDSVIKREKPSYVMSGACHATKAPTSFLLSESSNRETPLSPRSWFPFLSATQYNSGLVSKANSHAHQPNERIVKRASINDSPSAGYLADQSAPSSTPGTPHQKLGRRQRADRIMVLARARAILNQNVTHDSEDEELKIPATPLTISTRGKSCRHKLSPQAPQEKLSDLSSGNQFNLVYLKCVRTSRCLSALFIITYLPFLLMQILLYVLVSPPMLLVTILYMSCLLAVRPCLYGYQTPILRHAMRNVGKRPRTSSQEGDVHPSQREPQPSD